MSAAMQPLLPGSTLGVLGGGQLGRMFVHQAQAMGYFTAVLDADPTSPAGLVSHHHIQTGYEDPQGLAELARGRAGVKASGGISSLDQAYALVEAGARRLGTSRGVALMQALRDRGIKIGVLSNTMWPRWHHEAVFARDGLLDLIDGAVYTSEVSVAKPHRDAFHLAMESVGASPEDAVFVGDRPWDDIHGAQEAGMRAILVPHSRLGDQAVPVDVTPDAVVARLGDVLGIVDDWIAAAAPSPR